MANNNNDMISQMSKLINTVKTSEIIRINKHRVEFIINDIQNIVQTISLGKVNILNPNDLNFQRN